MTVTQTVEIPPSHRLTIEVPREVPAGRAILAFTPAHAAPEKAPDEISGGMSGLRRRYFTMSKEERAAEDARERELFKLHAEELNQEAEDVLLDQIDPFETISPYEQKL